MLTHPTLEQMASLGLNGMAAAWRALAEQDPGEALERDALARDGADGGSGQGGRRRLLGRGGPPARGALAR